MEKPIKTKIKGAIKMKKKFGITLLTLSLLWAAGCSNQSTTKEKDSEAAAVKKEVELLKRLGDYPQVIREAAEKRMPHRIPQYVFDLASDLHSFYNAEKVIDLEQKELTKARINLMKAVRIVIKDALQLIGVHAPEKM